MKAQIETRPELWVIESPSGTVLSVESSLSKAQRNKDYPGCPIVHIVRQDNGQYAGEDVVGHVPESQTGGEA